MDKKVVSQKIDNLINCLNRLNSRQAISADELINNYDLQDIISINIERAIQSCIDLSAHILADYDDLGILSSASIFLELGNKRIIGSATAAKLSKAAGFRNLLVHRYATIDWIKVHQNLSQELPIFRTFIEEVSRFCEL